MPPYTLLLTGATGSIGRAIAHRFATHSTIPFSLLLLGRSQPTLSSLLDSLPAPHARIGQRHAILSTNVADASFWRDLKWTHEPPPAERHAYATGDRIPVPHVLINSAGLVHRTLHASASQALLDETLDVNLRATMAACGAMGTRDAARARRKAVENAGGEEDRLGVKSVSSCIVNVSSLLARQGGVGAAAYAASKAGVEGFSRALAAEYGRLGIRVNTLVPGYIDGKMTDAEGEDMLKRIRERIPLRRLGTAEEVADAALFLVLNDYANNCVLNLDGGLSAMGPVSAG